MAKNVISEASDKINNFSDINSNFIQKLTLKGVTKRTIEVYTRNIAQISLFFNQNPLTLAESRQGISPKRSHGTVLETLTSYGSSYSITNILNIMDVPISNVQIN